MVAMDGKDSGRIMLHSIRRSFAPSIYADSSRLTGMPEKKVFMTIILYVEIAPGSQTAQYVFISPKSLTSMKLGIRPAPNSIVSVIRNKNTFLPVSLGLDRA